VRRLDDWRLVTRQSGDSGIGWRGVNPGAVEVLNEMVSAERKKERSHAEHGSERKTGWEREEPEKTRYDPHFNL